MTQPLPPIPFPQATPTPVSTATWLEVIGPQHVPELSGCTEALRTLHGLQQPLTLEIRAWTDGVAVGIQASSSSDQLIERALRGAMADWDIGPLRPPPPRGRSRYVSLLTRPGSPLWAPLRCLDSCDGDPLAVLLEAVQPLEPDEQALIRYLVCPAREQTLTQIWREVTSPAPARGWFGLLQLMADAAPRRARFDAALQRQLERRLSEPTFELLGAVALAGDDRERLISRAASLTAAYRSQFDAGYGGIELAAWGWQADPKTLPIAPRPDLPTILVTSSELAALWHPASGQVRVPGTVHASGPTVVLPPRIADAAGIPLGTHRQRGCDVPIRLPLPDLRSGPLIILGKTGQGKTTLGHRVLAALADSAPASAICLLDPHGDWAIDFAARSIPPQRVRQTYLIELGDSEWPIGLPLFRRPPGLSRDAFIAGTFQTFRLLYKEHWSPTRMETAVYSAVAALCHHPEATVLDVTRLFGDVLFRRQILRLVADPAVREFFAAYEQLSDAAKRELTAPILHRLNALYRSAPIRNILARSDGLDPADLLNEGAILLVSTAGPDIEAEADLLMELLIARMHLGFRARLAQPPAARRPAALAIDESQRIRGASLAALLSEGRKMGLAPLILLTQFLANWTEGLEQAVLGNNASLVSFALGPADARKLAPLLRPYTAEQLLDLHRHEAIAKLSLDGQLLSAFDLQTEPIRRHADWALVEQLRTQTRARFARPRREVEEALSDRGVASLSEARPGDFRADQQCDMIRDTELQQYDSDDEDDLLTDSAASLGAIGDDWRA